MVPLLNPEALFASEPYRETGAIFWPGPDTTDAAAPIWRSCRLQRPVGPEFAGGMFIADKRRCWEALRLSCWFRAWGEFYLPRLQNEAETLHLAFHRLQKSYGFVRVVPNRLGSAIQWTDFKGAAAFRQGPG